MYTPTFNTITGYTNFNGGDWNVAPGDLQTGSVTFEVPTNVSVASITWSQAFSTGSSATWHLPS